MIKVRAPRCSLHHERPFTNFKQFDVRTTLVGPTCGDGDGLRGAKSCGRGREGGIKLYWFRIML